MADLINKTLGPYQIVSLIGQGGMGTVYRAVQLSLNRSVALKVLPEHLAHEADFVQRFQREAMIAASLQHPNIVTIYDIGHEGDLYYIAMQLLEGCTLAQLIENEGVLPLPRTAHIISQVAAALDYAHQRNIVHRDVKPGNIFIGPGDHVTLMDFGIVRALDGTRLTRTGTMIGTPEYMSPEQIQGHVVDARSDLYSLGVVLYQMLSGRVPFTADTTSAVLYAHVHTPPPPLSQLNPAILPTLETVVLKALEKNPQARYQSGAQLVQALHAAAQQAELTLLDSLYDKAIRLTAEWKLDEAVAVWEQLRILRPDYKDAAARMTQAQQQRDALHAYQELVQLVRQAQERVASFVNRYPHFPDPERIKAVVPSDVQRRVWPGFIVAGIILLAGACVLIPAGIYQTQSAVMILGLTYTPNFVELWGTGHLYLGLGIGLGVAALAQWLLLLGWRRWDRRRGQKGKKA